VGIRVVLRLTPSRTPTETKRGAKLSGKDPGRPRRGQGWPLRGPTEATEAVRGPAGVVGEGAGENGFGDFCRSFSS